MVDWDYVNGFAADSELDFYGDEPDRSALKADDLITQANCKQNKEEDIPFAYFNLNKKVH